MKTMTPEGRNTPAQFSLVPTGQTDIGDIQWFPAVDIMEDADEYLFKIDLPDVRAEDIQVIMDEETLVISGQRPNPWNGNQTCLRIERPYGHFERHFPLPEDASQVELHSTWQGDVLELHIRKVRVIAPGPIPPAAQVKLRLRPAA
jgi:HSP20 family molecular chaperone IbpA